MTSGLPNSSLSGHAHCHCSICRLPNRTVVLEYVSFHMSAFRLESFVVVRFALRVRLLTLATLDSQESGPAIPLLRFAFSLKVSLTFTQLQTLAKSLKLDIRGKNSRVLLLHLICLHITDTDDPAVKAAFLTMAQALGIGAHIQYDLHLGGYPRPPLDSMGASGIHCNAWQPTHW